MLLLPTRSVTLIDDDPRVLASIGNLLASSGYSTQLFASPASFFLAGLCDTVCVVTDLGMRPIDGLAVLHWVKERRINLPVVIITGKPDERSEEECMGNGAAAFFRKPIDGDALVALIDGIS